MRSLHIPFQRSGHKYGDDHTKKQAPLLPARVDSTLRSLVHLHTRIVQGAQPTSLRIVNSTRAAETRKITTISRR